VRLKQIPLEDAYELLERLPAVAQLVSGGVADEVGRADLVDQGEVATVEISSTKRRASSLLL
jgi:hypothetical protein